MVRRRLLCRLRLWFWGLALVIGLFGRLTLGSSEAEVTYQTVHVPISSLQIDVGGEANSDPTGLAQAKGTLTHAVYRLLRSHYGGCLHHVDLDLSLEQNFKTEDLRSYEDHDLVVESSLDRVPADAQGESEVKEEKAVLTATGTATFYCRSTDMPPISIREIDDTIERSNETLHHVASIAFAAPKNTGNLYQSLVKIAFNNSSSSHSRSKQWDITGGEDPHDKDIGLTRGFTPLPLYQARLLEGDVSCMPQVPGRIKLQRGEYICSPNGEYLFGMSHKGDLCLLHNYEKKWSADTRGTYVLMQVDGNLVVRSSSKWPLWASRTSDNPDSALKLGDNGVVEIVNKNNKTVWRVRASSNLVPSVDSPPDMSDGLGVLEDSTEESNTVGITCVDQTKGKIRLYIGEFICSSDGRFRFGMPYDGDLSLWDQSAYPSIKVWSADTCCSDEDAYAKLQSDGNLVVSTISGVVLWTSRTVGAGPDSSLLLSNNGVASILDSQSRMVWSVRGVSVGQNTYENDDNDFSKLQGNSNTQSLSAIDDYSCIDQVDGRISFLQNEFICSPDGTFLFGIDGDGDLSLWSESTKVWSAETSVGEPTSAKLSQRGNLIVKTSSGEIVWTSKTANNPGASLSLRNNGNVVITNADGRNIWIVRGKTSPTTRPSPGPNDSLCIDQVVGTITLFQGEFICSPDGNYRFGMSYSGDLSLWTESIMIWSADTDGGAKVTLQTGGSMVVRDEVGEPIWTSRTSNNRGASLLLGNNGSANIVNVNGLTIWTTSTIFGDRGAGEGPLPPVPPTPALTSPPTPIPTNIVDVTPTTTDGCVSLSPDKIELRPGQFVCSPSGRYRFGLDDTGDLSIWNRSKKEWSSGTGGVEVEDIFARLKNDGDLVVRSASKLLWSSESAASNYGEGSTIQVHDDGVATITSSIGFYIWSSSSSADGSFVDPSTLKQKIMAGYQGWFYTDSDGGLNRWQHWSVSRTVPDKDTITIDMWPDMREYDSDELTATGFQYKDGSNAGLYSAYRTKTVERHCKWLQDYDIDGLFVQRFIGSAIARPHIRDKVLQNVRSGSEKYGRVFVNMYDIGNGDQRSLIDDIKRDWMHLVDDERITESKSYLRHQGRPLLALWGWGFNDRIGTPGQATELISWLQETAEPRYRATVMGGVPAGWRTLSRDSRTNDGWAKVYRSFDVISPWTVGRMVDGASADYFEKNYIKPDLKECESLGIDYLPVVFPGFSSHNLKPEKPFNEIPRLGGKFLWHQFRNAIRSGGEMIYVAMFDETDEGTAIFKVTENADQTPTKGKLLPLDADAGYKDIPSDWYLRLTGAAGKILKEGQQSITLSVPENP
eukprot:CAMPEP_0178544764 /NCGR_PEP_ID=MMETSP0697-20121206/3288_1 /TAXON_ID=265572 /ORGANISM="Extubocellulus spinifer, Strain CCMP396" /LENGTH=1333 /DNA_ID=CAMNT_0020177297 /DNA_START=5112 /DNA_END=9113 /DNA_ORIENTATION=+